jgi:periplasmic protein TonB
MLRALTWLLSLAIHAGLALALFLSPGGAALQQGTGTDLMVVQQGVALEGLTALGQDEATVQPVDAPPPQLAQPVQQQQVQPVQDTQVLQSAEGPEQQLDVTPKTKQAEQPKEQVATAVQETTVQQMQSSGKAETGGNTNALNAYIGALRSRLEKSKVNPRSDYIGTAIVRFTVDADGKLLSREIQQSSGSTVLDDAALASIDKAAPFPAMPSDLNRQQFTLAVPYHFTVHKR